MKLGLTRRDVIKTAGAAGALAGAASFGAPFVSRARAAEALSVVDWGPPWIDNTKKIAEAWGKGPIIWTLHSGGAASILLKIKAASPDPPYDLIDNGGP